MDDKAICERLKFIRKEMKLTQAEFADAADLNRAYLGQVETGRHLPSFNMLLSIATVHGISLDWLVFGRGYRYARPESDPLNNLSDEVVELIGLISRFPASVKLKLLDIFIAQVTLLIEAYEPA
jgi:transcriptional regulator with XRE-family HTH domain